MPLTTGIDIDAKILLSYIQLPALIIVVGKTIIVMHLLPYSNIKVKKNDAMELVPGTFPFVYLRSNVCACVYFAMMVDLGR